MKLNKYSWLAALPLLFTACQDDMLVEKHSQQGIYTLSATVEDGSASSRAQIVLNGTSTTKESFHWNEEDAFTLFQLPVKDAEGNVVTEMSSHEFTISDSYSDEKPAASADFSTLDALTVGREFVAFYPTPVVDTENSYKVSWNLESILPDNSVASWKDYFKNNLFMMVKGTVSNTTALTFEHLSGIIRITYKNTSSVDRKINGIFVNEGDMTTGVDFDLSNNCSLAGGRGRNGMVGLNFDNNATIAAGTSEDFYIIYMKNLFEDKGMSAFSKIQVITADNVLLSTPEYSKELPEMEAGKCYWYNVTDDGNGLSWTNAQQGEDDSEDEDSGNQDFVEKDVSTYTELKEALSVVTKTLDIYLRSDIALEGPLNVVSNTNIMLNGHTLSLSDNYKPGTSDAVFDVTAPLRVYDGTLQGKDGATLHKYYFKLSGRQIELNFGGTNLNTGTAIAHAVFMDDDRIDLNNITKRYSDGRIEVVNSSIVTSGDAIHYVAFAANPQNWSYINGNITGNVYLETTYKTLNTLMIFQTGTINGNLNTTNVNSDVVISEFIRKASVVTVGSGYTGWDKAGLHVENQRYSVSTFAELKAAIEAPQVADEDTDITLLNDITLESPLTVNKVTRIFGVDHQLIVSESFNWGTSDAVFINNGNDPFGLVDTKFIGCTAATANKYMVKSVDGRFYMTNASMTANGVAHGAYLEDSRITLLKNSNITVKEGGYALDFATVDSHIQIYISQMTGTVTGDVRFTANYVNSTYPNVIHLLQGTYNGDLIKAGTYADQLSVVLDAGVTVSGEGWPQPGASEESGDNEIDPDAKPVGTLTELKNALTWAGPIYLTADIELTSPLVVEYTKPIYMNGKTISLSENFEWGDADAAITSKSNLSFLGEGLIIGLETDETIEKAFLKSEDKLHLEGVTIKPLSFATAIHVKDAICYVNPGSTIAAARRYALNMEADQTCDVDIYKSEVYGDIRFALNAETYDDNNFNFCRFGVGPSSKVYGDLLIEGTYADTATGYHLEVETTAKTEGENWDDSRITFVTAR